MRANIYDLDYRKDCGTDDDERHRKPVSEADSPGSPDMKESPSDSPETLLALVPVKITNPIRDLVEKYCRSHGSGHVRQSIEHTNRHITDKRKYRAFLEKSLTENQTENL